MTLSGLLPVITADPDLQLALDQATQTPMLGGDLVAPTALRPLLVSALAGTGPAPAGVTVAVTATAREAEELAAALGSLVGPDRRSTNFNNEHGRTAAQFVLDCFRKYKVADPNVSDRYKTWLTGNASVFWSGDWVIGSSLLQQDLKFDVWKMPAFGGRRASQASLESIVIFKQDDQQRILEAARLLKWFIAHLREYDATIGDIAPTKSVQQDAAYRNRTANKYLWPVADAYSNHYTFPQISHPEQDLNYYGGPLLRRNLDRVWLGQASIQDGLDALEKDVKDVLAKAPIIEFKLV